MTLRSSVPLAPGVRAFAAALALAVILPAQAADQEAAASTIPDWYRADIAAMTRDGGRWIADNSARRSEAEPYDQYGLEWRASPDGLSMTGRLFGLRGGREVGEMWQFRQFWHPAEQRVYVMQWGAGGMYGMGVLTRLSETSGMLEQTFFTNDGRSFRIGHMYRNAGPDERTVEQYDVVPGEGAWRLDHSMTWRRTGDSG